MLYVPMAFPAHQVSFFVFYDLVFFCQRILGANHAVVTFVRISAGSAADQSAVDLTDSPVVGIAEKRQHMHQIMFLGKFCIRAL